MKRFGMFLAPLALWQIGSAAAGESTVSSAAPGISAFFPAPLTGWRGPAWRQVRIEQRWSIRITPGSPARPPSVVEEIEEEERVEQVETRRMGKCLAIGSIATLEAGDRNELLLFLHDQRIISATLEKRCSARDFYAGFYLVRNADGAICAGRDTLQSRSGANCKLKRLHELVPTGDRRFP